MHPLEDIEVLVNVEGAIEWRDVKVSIKWLEE